MLKRNMLSRQRHSSGVIKHREGYLKARTNEVGPMQAVHLIARFGYRSSRIVSRFSSLRIMW